MGLLLVFVIIAMVFAPLDYSSVQLESTDTGLASFSTGSRQQAVMQYVLLYQIQRIIVFVGSPLSGPDSDQPSMIKLAKKLKKNSVSVDVVAFGEAADEAHSSVLHSFVENVTQGDGS